MWKAGCFTCACALIASGTAPRRLLLLMYLQGAATHHMYHAHPVPFLQVFPNEMGILSWHALIASAFNM